ncbi:MAG: trigger factor [Verrucomicrobiota bacterium]|nr:trigger factor [Verrucomicrobiota bacterium]
MKVSFEDAGPCRKAILIDAPASEVLGEYDQVVDLFVKGANVRGFRQGRAPRHIVERQFARGILDETRDRLLPELYRKALEQERINPVAVVGVSDARFDKQQGMQVRVTVDLPPEFSLPKYGKIALNGRPVEITEKQVAEALEVSLESRARFQDVTGRAVKAGDLVKVDYEGQIEGRSVASLAPSLPGVGKGTDFWMLMDEPGFLPGFTNALVGANVGEERTVTVSFPQDHSVAALAGKAGAYRVRVKGVREKVRPILGPDLFGQFGVDSEASLRQKIREDLLKMAEAAEKVRLKDELAAFLLEKTEIDLPQVVVEHETNQAITSIVRRALMEGGSREQIERQKEAIVNAATRSSAEKIKLAYILSRIADEEKIQATEADVESHMQAVAARYKMPLERLKAAMAKDNADEKLKSDLRAEKTMDFLLEQAKIKRQE